ncbi:MAG: polysaccharide deacetylase family protein [Polyangia bacterium]
MSRANPTGAAAVPGSGAGAGASPSIGFVLEGGRSQADHSALVAVAEALERSGARVTLLHHGLGRLARLHLRSRLQKLQPELIVVSGEASLRDVRRLATVLGCPLVAYYWPDGAVHNIHEKRRPQRLQAGPATASASATASGPELAEAADRAPSRAGSDEGDGPAIAVLEAEAIESESPLPTRAVVASSEQAAEVRRHHGADRRRGDRPQPRLAAERVHLLPRLPLPPLRTPDPGATAAREQALQAHVTLLWEVLQERPHRSLRRGLLRAGVARLSRLSAAVDPRPRAVCLAYHQVLPELRGADLNLVVSASVLRRQVEALLRRGYEPLTVAQQVAAQADRAGLRRRTFSVSFDDGYRDTLEVAAPILKALGVPLTVYVISDVVAGALRLPWYELLQHALRLDGPHQRALAVLREDGDVVAGLGALAGAPVPRLVSPLLELLKALPGRRRDHLVDALWQAVGAEVLSLPRLPRYLDGAGVRELVSLGAEVSSHTRRHPILTTLDDEALADELLASRAAVQALCGACPGLAYPNGTSDARVQAAAAAAGYDYAVAVTPQRPASRFNLSRRMVSELSSLGLDGAYSEPIFVARVLGRLG